MVCIVLHEKLLVCGRVIHFSSLPGVVSRYKICKSLWLVFKLFIEVSLLAKMICVATINDKNISHLPTVIRTFGHSFHSCFSINRKSTVLFCSYTHFNIGIQKSHILVTRPHALFGTGILLTYLNPAEQLLANDEIITAQIKTQCCLPMRGCNCFVLLLQRMHMCGWYIHLEPLLELVRTHKEIFMFTVSCTSWFNYIQKTHQVYKPFTL